MEALIAVVGVCGWKNMIVPGMMVVSLKSLLSIQASDVADLIFDEAWLMVVSGNSSWIRD
jgi:hypothetical protein